MRRALTDSREMVVKNVLLVLKGMNVKNARRTTMEMIVVIIVFNNY